MPSERSPNPQHWTHDEPFEHAPQRGRELVRPDADPLTAARDNVVKAAIIFKLRTEEGYAQAVRDSRLRLFCAIDVLLAIEQEGVGK
jgi:hypothetical protein